MNLQYIKPEDWRKVFERYPGAESMLISISLERELAELKQELKTFNSDHAGRRAWVINRIAELEQRFG